MNFFKKEKSFQEHFENTFFCQEHLFTKDHFQKMHFFQSMCFNDIRASVYLVQACKNTHAFGPHDHFEWAASIQE